MTASSGVGEKKATGPVLWDTFGKESPSWNSFLKPWNYVILETIKVIFVKLPSIPLVSDVGSQSNHNNI